MSAKGFLKWDGTVNIAMVAILVSAVLAYGIQQANSSHTKVQVNDLEVRVRAIEASSVTTASDIAVIKESLKGIERIEKRLETRGQ